MYIYGIDIQPYTKQIPVSEPVYYLMQKMSPVYKKKSPGGYQGFLHDQYIRQYRL